MRSNRPALFSGNTTYEGGPARILTAEQELRRSVMSCMLFEGQFYESGETIAKRIQNLIVQVDPNIVAQIAIEAREKMNLRHAPLFIVREMARLNTPYRSLVAPTLERVIQRADELAEFLALYWTVEKPCECFSSRRCRECNGTGVIKTVKTHKEEPVSAQVKKGLARAFRKFDAYQLAKYNRDHAIKLRDVMFLTHPKPQDANHADIQKLLAADMLATPDTWEVAISAAKGPEEKRAEWERLLRENKLGAMALIRNLRNFEMCGVDESFVNQALFMCKPERVLPFRFIAAARHAPNYAQQLEQLMFKNLFGVPKLMGRTVLLVDVSYSMNEKISEKSEMTRMDAASGLAVLAREICENVRILTFSNSIVAVPNYRGLALAQAVVGSQPHSGTYLGQAVTHINQLEYDRLIVFTDEQSADKVPNPKGLGYCVNIASERPGVGYGEWMHIDGWSQTVIDYIREFERFGENA
jgi:60 kDa SS-A/Ro ribonucleoprotein